MKIILTLLTLALAPWHALGAPPYSGTVFVDEDIIVSSDTSVFESLVPTGRGDRQMFDRREGWVTVNAFLFRADYTDGLSIEFQVNPEFEDETQAQEQAERYAPIIGRLPYALRKDVETSWIHRGDEPFGGGNNNLLIHTDRAETRIAEALIEEVLSHEAAHTSLDADHAEAAGWLDAQVADDEFVSTYARDNSTREDIAESFLMYLAVRHRRDRISAEDAASILDAIPNRIAYFDSLDLDLSPMVTGSCDGTNAPSSLLAIEKRIFIANPGNNLQQQTFIRLVNDNDVPTDVEIVGIDDAGRYTQTVSMTLDAGASKQITAQDLEDGNPAKGLSGSLCDGQGKWQLIVKSDNVIRVISLIRTTDGFLTALDENTTQADNTVYFANPASNENQQTFLRIVNRSTDSGEVSVTGIDDSGLASTGTVTLTLEPNEARQMTIQDLENGNVGKGLTGSLDDGSGKWRLTIQSALDLKVMSLIRSKNGFLTNLSATVEGNSNDGHIIYFANPGSNLTNQTFLRIINTTTEIGTVTVSAVDDAGNIAPGGDLTFELGANAATQLTTKDLENGNLDKGLNGMLGLGDGRWVLTVSAEFDLTVMSLVRTPSGFLTNLSSTTPVDVDVNQVWIFNPASNTNQRSSLRLVNMSGAQGSVTISGIDDAGNSAPDGEVIFNIPAGSAMAISAIDLENGNADLGLVGSLGDGAGKWRLKVSSDVDLKVQSLLETSTGFLTNLSRSSENSP